MFLVFGQIFLYLIKLFFIFEGLSFLKLRMAKFDFFNFIRPGNPIIKAVYLQYLSRHIIFDIQIRFSYVKLAFIFNIIKNKLILS